MGRGKPVPFSLKSILNIPVKAALKRADFVKLVNWLATLDPGKTCLAERADLPPAFADEEQIRRLACDLTERALAEKGAPFSRQEIQGHVDMISCRYDYELHKAARGAIFNLITHLFATKSLQDLYVSADKRELRHLERVRSAQRDGIGTVYLVNHTSHFDEFILDIFLDSLGLTLPLFAAGLNMMFTPSLTKLFMLGSYVIVRKGASRSYLASLHHWCQALAEMGKPQGIFLEAWSGGARTRDGSLRIPRRLVTIQGALSARGDVLVQPAAISYSRVPEDLELSEGLSLASWANGSHVLRSLPGARLHPLRALARGTKGLYGRAFVSFGEGRLLSELKSDFAKDSQGLELDEFAALYAIKEIARDKKIMASSLAALALGHAQKSGRKDLVNCAEECLAEVKDYHQRTFGMDPDLEDFIRENPLAGALDDGLRSLAARRVTAGRSPFSRGAPPRIRRPHALSYYDTHGDRRLYSPSARENIVVCSGGAWGYAMGVLLGRRTLNDRKYHNSSLSLYDPSEEDTQSLGLTRTHPDFRDTRLPKNVFPTSDAVEAFRKANLVVVAAPPGSAPQLISSILESAQGLKTIILASRGFDPLSHRLPVQIAWEAAAAAGFPDLDVCALSGPFAPRDLIGEKGGLWILAGAAKDGKPPEAALFRGSGFQVFSSDDPAGVQAAAALADAYTLYGAALKSRRELKTPAETADFFREASSEALTLAMAMGASPGTFASDNPSWSSELLFSALSWQSQPILRQCALGGKEYFVSSGLLDEKKAASLWPDRGVLGFQSIRSAYLLGKNLALRLPHLEKAYELFWGSKG
jgi:glycerol-3-phosphate dehydrogenase